MSKYGVIFGPYSVRIRENMDHAVKRTKIALKMIRNYKIKYSSDLIT